MDIQDRGRDQDKIKEKWDQEIGLPRCAPSVVVYRVARSMEHEAWFLNMEPERC